MNRVKTWMKSLICQRVANAGFVCVCVAALFGCPNEWVMGVSAALYALLVWMG